MTSSDDPVLLKGGGRTVVHLRGDVVTRIWAVDSCGGTCCAVTLKKLGFPQRHAWSARAWALMEGRS